MNFAIIAAGGKGKRFQSGEPKQLCQLGGRTVLGRSLGVFEAETGIDAIVVTFPADDPQMEQRYREMVAAEKITKAKFVAGGDERRHSVQNAFRAIGSAAEDDLVLIHDAARPLLSGALLKQLIAAGKNHGAVIPAIAVHETLKLAENDRIVKTVSRQNMYVAQTPQVFRYGMLKAAYERVAFTEAITDEAILMEAAGFDVWIVPGEKQNLKITEPDDLRLAEYYLGQGGA